jgi:hypothetical protein
MNTFADLLIEGKENENKNISMLGCISLAAEIIQISEKCLSVLENNIDNFDAKIRSISFKGLRFAQDKGYKSTIFR